MARRKKKSTKRSIQSYSHQDKERSNNPPVGLVTPATDPGTGTRTYDHDSHIDPELSWAGKSEHMSFEVPTVSLHVHERIDPRTILKIVRKKSESEQQLSLFDHPAENPPIRQAIEFYKHRHNWSNRMIAGDSLLVMNSLLEKEALGGKVQTIYFDPPYGVTYGSNFQPFVSQREVKSGDRSDDLTREPETLRAFRDTWELGIHSYLTYLRDRLLLARELMTDSGSCFVQIGKDNVHRVALVMDEVFGAQNRISTITYVTSGGSSASTLPGAANYLLWYAKDQSRIKYRQLYEPLSRQEILDLFSWHAMVELPNGETRKPTQKERIDPSKHLPAGARIYGRMQLLSPGTSTTGRSEPFEWDGNAFKCPIGQQWRVSPEGLELLARINRLDAASDHGVLRWKRYEDEVAGRRIHNVWSRKMNEQRKLYVVQSAILPIQRCILMTSDPGDLVFDPTCGSGTTADVAEQWGRRWITCDTSRVALTIAKQRLMAAIFDYYKLQRPDEGVGSGFKCHTVETVSASILGYNKPRSETILYDQPHIDKSKIRVTGPFTVEAVPAPHVEPLYSATPASDPLPADQSVTRTGVTARQGNWRAEILKSGIRSTGGKRIHFSRLEPMPGAKWLHAEGEYPPPPPLCTDSVSRSKRAVISFGPDYAPLEQRQVASALEEAHTLVPQPNTIVFAAFQFDPEAAKDIHETAWPGITLLKVQMNADLLTEDLKKKQTSNESFWLIGQPDVHLDRMTDDKYRVSVHGFDYYDVGSGTLESGGPDRIAMWLLDPDYDGRSLFPRQVFFPMAGKNQGWTKLAKTLKSELDPKRINAYHGTESLPFKAGDHQRAAVKIIDDRGIESLKIIQLEG